MLRLPETTTLYPHATAQAIADANNADDEDGWTYTAVRANDRQSLVQITDADGHIIGRL